MNKICMYEAKLPNLRNAVNQLARIDKSFAERLVFYQDIRTAIKSGIVVHKLGFDIFNKSGDLIKEDKIFIDNIIKKYKLPNDSTWFDALKISHNKWKTSKNPTKNSYNIFDYMCE